MKNNVKIIYKKIQDLYCDSKVKDILENIIHWNSIDYSKVFFFIKKNINLILFKSQLLMIL